MRHHRHADTHRSSPAPRPTSSRPATHRCPDSHSLRSSPRVGRSVAIGRGYSGSRGGSTLGRARRHGHQDVLAAVHRRDLLHRRRRLPAHPPTGRRRSGGTQVPHHGHPAPPRRPGPAPTAGRTPPSPPPASGAPSRPATRTAKRGSGPTGDKPAHDPGGSRGGLRARSSHPPGRPAAAQRDRGTARPERLGAEHSGARPSARGSSSSASTGLTAVCQTTAWEPYSAIDQSLSTTWYRYTSRGDPSVPVPRTQVPAQVSPCMRSPIPAGSGRQAATTSRGETSAPRTSTGAVESSPSRGGSEGRR